MKNGIVVATLAALASCSDDRAGSNVAISLADSMCGISFDCCTTEERNLVLGHFVDEATCVDRLVNSATIAPSAILDHVAFLGAEAALPNLRALDQAIERGRVGVDQEALTACLEYLDELPCNTIEEVEEEGCVPPEPFEPSPCDAREIFTGKVGENGTCTSSVSGLECGEGLTCRIDFDVGIEGVCIARGDEGDLCFSNSECQEDLYCSGLTGLCSVPKAEGEACFYADPNDPTPEPGTLVIACEQGLRCDPITDRCVVACQRGAACAGDDDCDEESGYTCVMGRCDLPRSAERPCAVDDDCEESLRCIDDPAFPETLVCADPLELGESCNPFSPNEECASGYCDAETRRCAEPVGPGDLCPTGDDDQCDGGYCEGGVECIDDDACPGDSTCDLGTGLCEAYCVEQRADGASCDVAAECQSEACVVGTCRTLPLNDGQRCESGFQCESLFCGLDEPRVCERLPLANGSSCLDDSQCASGICHQDSCNAGLTEGQTCNESDITEPPCARDLFCNPDEPEPACRPLHAAGEPCDASYQCRGSCILQFGRFFCDGTPEPGTLMCEGT